LISKAPVKLLFSKYFLTGKGTHVLLSGHDKNKGDELLVERTNDSLGTVKVVLWGNSEEHEFRDVALTELPAARRTRSGVTAFNTISQASRTVTLSNVIKTPKKNAVVMRFANSETNCERGKIHHTTFYCLECNSERVDIQDCITIVKSTRGINRNRIMSFHSDGESGSLATTLPNRGNSNRVKAIAMLVGVTTLIFDTNEEEQLSIGVRMRTILNELSNDPYCRGARVQLI